MSPKLIIFDWDGTLVDSHGRIITAMRAAIAELELEERTDMVIENIIGLGLLEAAKSLYPDLKDNAHDSLVDAYRRNYLERYDGPNPLFPEVEDVLGQLLDMGLLLAVATGKSRKGLQRDLAGLNLGKYLVASRCADETESKPSPKMLYELMQELQVEAKEAWMIGDSAYDLEMARRAKVPSIAVAYADHKHEQLSPYRPMKIIDSLRCLPELLQ